MPNWCEGTLKIRGTVKQLRNFVETAFEKGDYFFGESSDTYIFVNLKDYSWLKGSYRAFCSGAIEVSVDKTDDKSIAVLDFKQAWNVKSEVLLELAQKTGVDLKLYAFERGMEFNRDIEILNGVLVKDKTITFDNYYWDCVCPLIGG